MPAQAQFVREEEDEKFVASAVLVPGQVVQTPDGLAGVVNNQAGAAVGDITSVHKEGVFVCQKTTGVCCLKGGRAWFVRSTGKVHSVRASGDFYLGTFAEDAIAGATTVRVNLNSLQYPKIDLKDGSWTSVGVGASTATKLTFGGAWKLACIATSEAEKIDALSDLSIARADGPIMEFEATIVDPGTSVMDINIGLANGTNATDADAITEHCFIHFDGTQDIKAQSKDGTTTVAATDTTVDAVASTFFEAWIDVRNPADIQIYVNGVNVLPATVFRLDNAVGPLKALVHIEKTSSTETGDIRIRHLTVRPTDLGLTD